MLGNEPNQGRVISKNHSMKCKLGTVQVWTKRAEDEEGRPEIPKGQAEPGLGPQQRSRPKIQDLGAVRLRMSLCLRLCFGNRVAWVYSGLGGLLWSCSLLAALVLLAWCYLARPQPLTNPHHMQR